MMSAWSGDTNGPIESKGWGGVDAHRANRITQQRARDAQCVCDALLSHKLEMCDMT